MSTQVRRQPFYHHTEQDLVEHILLLKSRLYGLTRDSLLRLAFQIAKANNIQTRFNESKQMAGKRVGKGFFNPTPRNQSEITRANLSLALAAVLIDSELASFLSCSRRLLRKKSNSRENVQHGRNRFHSSPKTPENFCTQRKHQVGSITSCERGRKITFVCCVSAVCSTAHHLST